MSLEMLKAILTTLILALALVQALGMAQVRGYVRLLPVGKKQLVRLHHLGGAATLLLALAVAAMCVLGERYAYYSLRVQAHAVMGVLAILILAIKAVITNRSRRYLRHALALGTAAGLLVLGTFIASALWYFVQVA